MQSGDTIVAISSPVGGACARIIVRLSGPQSQCLTESLLDPDRKQAIPGATSAAICWLRFGRFPGVPAWIYLFIAPHSVTGEDVIELHLPGSVLLARALLAELMNRGARHAEPGEFTARGFFNGKFDLAEAEGVAAIIAAHSQAQLDAARRMMSGELARRLTPAMESITQTLALLEAGIDFADEGVTILSEDALAVRIDGAVAELRGLLEASVRFERLVHEPTVVLAGRPNAGKSTLLNALAGYERAIVSPVAGTTRDALGATVRLARGLIHVIDVAGFDAPKSSEIERQMHETASRNVETSDVVVLICDSTDDRPPIKLLREPDMTVFSKSDLVSTPGRSDALVVSALTGAGMDLLRAGLDELCFARTSMGQVSGITLGARHIASIEAAVKSLRRARAATASGAELVALDLREALDELGSILGLITRDDVLGRVFSTFCIGK